MQNFNDIVAERWPAFSAAALACLIAIVLPRLVEVIRISSIPTIGTELGGQEKRRQAYLGGARKLYNDGYRKVRHRILRPRMRQLT
jgi:hypothetical protein